MVWFFFHFLECISQITLGDTGDTPGLMIRSNSPQMLRGPCCTRMEPRAFVCKACSPALWAISPLLHMIIFIYLFWVHTWNYSGVIPGGTCDVWCQFCKAKHLNPYTSFPVLSLSFSSSSRWSDPSSQGLASNCRKQLETTSRLKPFGAYCTTLVPKLSQKSSRRLTLLKARCWILDKKIAIWLCGNVVPYSTLTLRSLELFIDFTVHIVSDFWWCWNLSLT